MKMLAKLLFCGLFLWGFNAQAADYKIDVSGQHASIHFKVRHLGFSWLLGRFNRFTGSFSYDAANPNASKLEVVIDTGSVDSNHAVRDKHLRGKAFLNVKKHPGASFVSTSYKENRNGTGTMEGRFTLNGVTRDLTLRTERIGHGADPWGGYRVGFSATTQIEMKDFSIKMDLGPASRTVYLDLYIEGIRQ